jgi:hypothetical protein
VNRHIVRLDRDNVGAGSLKVGELRSRNQRRSGYAHRRRTRAVAPGTAMAVGRVLILAMVPASVPSRSGILLALLSIPFSSFPFAPPPLCAPVFSNDGWESGRRGRDLQQWVITGVDRDRQSLAILAQVKVGASGRWVHALVSNTDDGLAASNSIANGTVAGHSVGDIEGERISIQSATTSAAVDDASRFRDLDKGMVGMLFSNDAGIAGFASVVIGALEALEAHTDDAVEAEIARGVMDGAIWRSWSGSGLVCNRGVDAVMHRANVDHNLAWSVERDELVISKGVLVFLNLVYHACIAVVKVGAVEALVANTDNRIGLAAVASDAHVLDGSRLVGWRFIGALAPSEAASCTGGTGARRGKRRRWNGGKHVIVGCGVDHGGIVLCGAARAKVVIGALVTLVAHSSDMLTTAVAPNVGVQTELLVRVGGNVWNRRFLGGRGMGDGIDERVLLVRLFVGKHHVLAKSLAVYTLKVSEEAVEECPHLTLALLH